MHGFFSRRNRRTKVTKAEIVRRFREDVLPHVIAHYGRADRVAIREEWNNWTDALCKDGEISLQQYDSWSNPF
jgi:hypothetical protein